MQILIFDQKLSTMNLKDKTTGFNLANSYITFMKSHMIKPQPTPSVNSKTVTSLSF